MLLSKNQKEKLFTIETAIKKNVQKPIYGNGN